MILVRQVRVSTTDVTHRPRPLPPVAEVTLTTAGHTVCGKEMQGDETMVGHAVTPRLWTDCTVSFEHCFDFKVFDVGECHVDALLFGVRSAVNKCLVFAALRFVTAFALVTLETRR